MQNKSRRVHESEAAHRAETIVGALDHILQETHVDRAFVEQCMQDCRESAARPARVVLVGTSNAGKTTLANALLGQLVAFSDSVPNTVLPVEYVLTEAECYSLNVGGKGVKELVGASPASPSLGASLTREATFQALRIINDVVRKRLREMQDLAELSAYDADAEDLQHWHVRISVPRDTHVLFLTDFVLVDCPGGSEKADADDDDGGTPSSFEGVFVGLAIRNMLRLQMQRSTLVVCATRSEKMESLRNRYDAHALFGGQPPLRRRGAFVINAVDDEDCRHSAAAYLDDHPSILANLEPLQVTGRTFFVSARSMLAYRLCSKVFPQRLEQGHEDESDDVWDNPRLVNELRLICQNVNMSPKIARTAMSGVKLRDVVHAQYLQDFSDNAGFHKMFSLHLSEEWPNILSESIVNRVIQKLSEQRDALKRKLELHRVPVEKLKAMATDIQKRMDDVSGMRDNIMSELQAALPARSQVDDACDWLSMTDYSKMTPQSVTDGFWKNPAPQSLAIAAAYKSNSTWTKHAGSGERRVEFKTKQRLQDFLAEFQLWIASIVAAVFGGCDEVKFTLPLTIVPPGDAAAAAHGYHTFACGHELDNSFWTAVARDTTAAVLEQLTEPKLRKQLAESKQLLQDLQIQLQGQLPAETLLESELSRVAEAEVRVRGMLQASGVAGTDSTQARRINGS